MKRKLSRKRFLAFAGIAFLLMIGLLLGIGEVAARWSGHEPWRLGEVKIKVEPGGKLFTVHPKLGYTHIPGEYVVTMPNGFEFKMTHLDNSLRVTRPLAEYDAVADRDEIWTFGCSVTHGWTVDDHQGYPWVLQEMMPQHEIVNFAAVGYGTLHSLIQFQEALEKRSKPAAVVIGYAAFHDKRNTFLRSRRKLIATWNKLGPLVQPYGRLDEAGKLVVAMETVEYRLFPLMQWSALVHLLEKNYNRIEDESLDSRAVTQAILVEFARVANEHGIPLVVAGVHIDPSTRAVLQFCRERGMHACNLRVNLGRPHNQNTPARDEHPSPKAHQKYARALHGFLTKSVLH